MCGENVGAGGRQTEKGQRRGRELLELDKYA